MQRLKCSLWPSFLNPQIQFISSQRRPYPDLSGSVCRTPGPEFSTAPDFFYFALLDRQSAWISKTCPDICSIFIKLLFPLLSLLAARVCWTLASQVKKYVHRNDRKSSIQINIKNINILPKVIAKFLQKTSHWYVLAKLERTQLQTGRTDAPKIIPAESNMQLEEMYPLRGLPLMTSTIIWN